MRNNVKYYLTKSGEFVIDNYLMAKPFSSFFPGIAGEWGIPMWVFYVNRGQGICSFGIHTKDKAILEFYPANNAYRLVQIFGYRTFLKIKMNTKEFLYEPFQNGFGPLHYETTSRMHIDSHTLRIEEINSSLGIKVGVHYFTVPNEDIAAIARCVTIENNCRSQMQIEVLDGIPAIIPFGMNGFFMKSMSKTVEAWMEVLNLASAAPYYKLKMEPSDRPEIEHVVRGNFYTGFATGYEGKTAMLKPVVDPQIIFGEQNDLRVPCAFWAKGAFSAPSSQKILSKTPSAMGFCKDVLKPSGRLLLYSYIGHVKSVEQLNRTMKTMCTVSYFEEKERQNKELIETLKSKITTASNIPAFDLYVKQTYLDNVIRGGYPKTIVGSEGKKSVFYLYSRKHGDLERDYNYFELLPVRFSQGNGNFRDMCQNRRNDLWFNPDGGEMNIIDFYSLIQADGFNPLVVKNALFVLRGAALDQFLEDYVHPSGQDSLRAHIEIPFVLGKIVDYIEDKGIRLNVSMKDFVAAMMTHAHRYKNAEHGEGFWIDHWTYLLDLLESYEALYPERMKEIIFEKRCFTFYDNAHVVRPRSEKYVLFKKDTVRQFNAVFCCPQKEALISSRKIEPYKVRTCHGKGEIYFSFLIVKMMCIVMNKMASLDPSGVGIEMEADKPSWYDPVNGLPGLLASSSCETFELLRLVRYMLRILAPHERVGAEHVPFPSEMAVFLKEMNAKVHAFLKSTSSAKDYEYWDKAQTEKELYREKTRMGFSGEEENISFSYILSFLQGCEKKLIYSVNKAYDKTKGLYWTYFINEVKDYEYLHTKDAQGNVYKKLSHRDKLPCVKATAFLQKPLVYFLEAQVHALKITKDFRKSAALAQAVRRSALYDKVLKMYKLNVNLEPESEEIGRTRVFDRGWLENESIWLHMEYKYILELLRCGHYEEFYDDFFNVLIPFQPPTRYGRSILENSSFLASSVFGDKRLWGNGFVARLSGSTAELIHIWLIMNMGHTPFQYHEGQLTLTFSPLLSRKLFTSSSRKYSYRVRDGIVAKGVVPAHAYSFLFLGEVLVTYHNPSRKDTFGKRGSKVERILFEDVDGVKREIAGAMLPAPYAEQVRDRQIRKIDVYLK